MPEVMQFDAEVSQQLEAAYLTPEIVQQRRLQLAALDLKPGENVLDIGSGPGLLAVQAAGPRRGGPPRSFERIVSRLRTPWPAAEPATCTH